MTISGIPDFTPPGPRTGPSTTSSTAYAPPGGGAWRSRLSSRRPAHAPSTEQVHVEVRHRLTAVGTDIHHETITPGPEAQLLRHLRREAHQAAGDSLSLLAVGRRG